MFNNEENIKIYCHGNYCNYTAPPLFEKEGLGDFIGYPLKPKKF